jgi:hypothetical protein
MWIASCEVRLLYRRGNAASIRKGLWEVHNVSSGRCAKQKNKKKKEKRKSIRVPVIFCRAARSFVTACSTINNFWLPCGAGEGDEIFVTNYDEGGRGEGVRNMVTSQKS